MTIYVIALVGIFGAWSTLCYLAGHERGVATVMDAVREVIAHLERQGANDEHRERP